MVETLQNQAGSDNDDYGALTSWALRQSLQDPEVIQRFWSKVDKSNSAGCWLWTSNLVGQLGHGQFHVGRFGGRLYNEYAHRFVWMLTNGSIPTGKQINHHCDVPACVNPDHLYLGTQLDNMRDAVARHRFPLTRRPKKLSDDVVRAIRVLIANGVAQSLVASAFKVSKALVSLIVSGQRRLHVPATYADACHQAHDRPLRAYDRAPAAQANNETELF